MFRDLIQRKKDAIRTGQAEGDNLLGLLLQSSSQNNLPENVMSTKDNAITLEEVIEGNASSSTLLAMKQPPVG